MNNIKTNRKYIPQSEYKRLVNLAEEQGVISLTKKQYCQCLETSLFNATGVTRE